MSLAGGSCELDAMARRVIEGNRYMTLGTVEPDGAPRLSPVYYTPARHTDFYWVSSPEARHSRNIGRSGRVVGEGHRGSLMSMPVQQR
jgi:nitroimidazol reductase NimA-like FMN-containing flavoprotein (pyridoxamine 5'-phosphate oxidase superfamily)